ncbi:hypothetical protein MSAN_02449500 [Mycena sanguinolenta]|uniref:Uncharacterized protein n=1 Tax=Mycena sanguinolenta TaxID=230812 RepID=A0A8H6WXZ1_9AGAR|nr:hypothetical protein MSAN_02449500 [Mycena sanguinolenta]
MSVAQFGSYSSPYVPSRRARVVEKLPSAPAPATGVPLSPPMVKSSSPSLSSRQPQAQAIRPGESCQHIPNAIVPKAAEFLKMEELETVVSVFDRASSIVGHIGRSNAATGAEVGDIKAVLQFEVAEGLRGVVNDFLSGSFTDAARDAVYQKIIGARGIVQITCNILHQISQSRNSPDLVYIRHEMSDFEARWALSELEGIPNCRVEYWNKTLVVTCGASFTHDSFNVLLKSITQLVHAIGGLEVETNTAVRGDTVEMIPDLYIRNFRGPTDPEASILLARLIFECAYMNDADLTLKAKAYFEAAQSILAVICIYIETKGKYSRPNRVPPDDADWLADLKAGSPNRRPLGAVMVRDHNFGEITGVSAVIHRRDGNQEKFNLLDSDDQARFELQVHLFLGKIASPAKILGALRENQGLTMDFNKFIEALDERLQLDARKRYYDWISRYLTPEQSDQKRRRDARDGPNYEVTEVDEAEIEEELRKRKRTKM